MKRAKTTAPRLTGQCASEGVVNAVPKNHDGPNEERSRMMKAMIGILGLVLVVGGCKKECFILPGTYSMSLAPKTGDCPDNIITQFSAYADQVSIPPATACTRFLTTIEGDADTCKLMMDVSAKADESGLNDGVGIFRVACEDKFTCRHEFDVTFTGVAAAP